eukprot:COSAG05_NODE_3484_length_2033_cov_1.113237_2_plen_48_part_00
MSSELEAAQELAEGDSGRPNEAATEKIIGLIFAKELEDRAMDTRAAF